MECKPSEQNKTSAPLAPSEPCTGVTLFGPDPPHTLNPVGLFRKQVKLLDNNREPREITIARWSPVDSSLAFVGSDYDVYYVPTMTKPNAAKRLTFDGSKDLYNGVADWTYSSESPILGRTRGVWLNWVRLGYFRAIGEGGG